MHKQVVKEMFFPFEITDKSNNIFFSVFVTGGLSEILYSLADCSHKTT